MTAASAGPDLRALSEAPRGYRVVEGKGFTIAAPSAFQQSQTTSSTGEPTVVLRRPSSVSALPSSVVVLRDPRAKEDVVEQSYALDLAKRTAAKATDVERLDVVWRGARRAVEVCHVASRRREDYRLEPLMRFEPGLGPTGAFTRFRPPQALVDRLLERGERVPGDFEGA